MGTGIIERRFIINIICFVCCDWLHEFSDIVFTPPLSPQNKASNATFSGDSFGYVHSHLRMTDIAELSSDSFFSQFHPSCKVFQLSAVYCIIFSSALGHQLLYSLIQTNFGFQGQVLEICSESRDLLPASNESTNFLSVPFHKYLQFLRALLFLNFPTFPNKICSFWKRFGTIFVFSSGRNLFTALDLVMEIIAYLSLNWYLHFRG